MRISDWSSDVCSSDLSGARFVRASLRWACPAAARPWFRTLCALFRADTGPCNRFHRCCPSFGGGNGEQTWLDGSPTGDSIDVGRQSRLSYNPRFVPQSPVSDLRLLAVSGLSLPPFRPAGFGPRFPRPPQFPHRVTT